MNGLEQQVNSRWYTLLRAPVLIAVTLVVVALNLNLWIQNRINQGEALTSSRVVAPELVCPGFVTSGSTFSSLPNSAVRIRVLDGKLHTMMRAGRANYLMAGKPILVSSSDITSVSYSKTSGSGFAFTSCSTSPSEQWFVGGSGALLTKSTLNLVNSGMSDALVAVTAYSPTGQSSLKSISIKSNSSENVSLDALAPGEAKVVLRVQTRSGRVSAFLFEENVKGLVHLGGDYIAPVPEAAKSLTIPAIANFGPTGAKVTQILRLFVPGTLNSLITMNVLGVDTNYVPVGFDERNIPAGRTIDIPLSIDSSNKYFGLIVRSSQPIVASVNTIISGTSHPDFSWSVPAPTLSHVSMNLSGRAPLFTFIAPEIAVQISWKGSSGASGKFTLQGNDYATWRPSQGIVRVTLTAQKKEIAAGALFSDWTGRDYFGLSAFSILNDPQTTTGEIPLSDAAVVTRN